MRTSGRNSAFAGDGPKTPARRRRGKAAAPATSNAIGGGVAAVVDGNRLVG